jgi:hypothetical protein
LPKLSDLLNEPVPVKLIYRGREYNLEAYPERYTTKMREESAAMEAAKPGDGEEHTFKTLIKSWDVAGEDDQPLPVSRETIAGMGEGFKVAIFTAIIREGANPTTAASAGS